MPIDSVAANDLLRNKNALNGSLELHQRKAEMFYQRKRTARLQAQQTLDCAAICFEFQKNLICPNISTKDVYYSRQLSFYSFNIHIPDLNVFEVPDKPIQAYIAPLPLSCEKLKDLLKLKKFESEQNKSFYDQLPVDNLLVQESEPEQISE